VAGEAAAIRGDGSVRVLVGVDRLDYTKGIPGRLLAYERMLHTHPELREKVRLVQVAVPSRTNVGAYQDFRALVDGLVGRINGVFGTPRWVPVHYIFRALSEPDLVALYRAADVMLVTPLRDGMNLVAKEFVVCQQAVGGAGVLLLSEFAGAAEALPEALPCNPFDVEGLSGTLELALELDREDRRWRIEALSERVARHDVFAWLGQEVGALEAVAAERRRR
jgi:trehalose 6-phosphate synthase/phosphatase